MHNWSNREWKQKKTKSINVNAHFSWIIKKVIPFEVIEIETSSSIACIMFGMRLGSCAIFSNENHKFISVLDFTIHFTNLHFIGRFQMKKKQKKKHNFQWNIQMKENFYFHSDTHQSLNCIQLKPIAETVYNAWISDLFFFVLLSNSTFWEAIAFN